MIKKILKLLILLIIILPLAYISIYFIQNITLKNSYVTYNEGQGKDSFVRCNYNILKPEFAIVFWALDQGHIGFKKTNMFFQTDEEWRNSRTGGTTVKNTTFEELVKMAKEDCSQFQKGYLDYTGYEHLTEQEKKDRYWEIDEKNLGWTYTPYTPDPEPTEEEKARKRALEEMTEEERAEWEEMMLQRTLELGKKTKRLSDDEVRQLLMDE